MSRLVDIDSLKGCAIIRPTSHESIEYIKQCGNDVLNHNDIPTAYSVDAVVAGIRRSSGNGYRDIDGDYVPPMIETKDAIDIVRKGGVE